MANRGCSVINVLTAAVLGLVVLIVVGLILLVAAPEFVASVAGPFGERINPPVPEPQVGAVEPTPTMAAVAVLPTTTNSGVGVQLAATWTPAPEVPTPIASATNTRRPTVVPSLTPTFPPRTPTPTPTNTPTPTYTPSPTPTPGPSPTPTNTRSAFLFTKSEESPEYRQNYANTAGCDWLGIAGEVLNVSRDPVPGGQYQVHVWACGVDMRVPAGSAPAYGRSGYEVYLFDEPVVRSCNVQLETTSGSLVSEVYTVRTEDACNANLTLFNFVQNR